VHYVRHKYRLIFAVIATILCAAVTGMAQRAIQQDNFPKETCLPFFTDYKQNMRRFFIILSIVFWLISLIMLLMLCLSLRSTTLMTLRSRLQQSHPQLFRCLSTSRLYTVVIVELVLLVMIILVNHYYVPEQVLRAQAGGQLAESQWTFGQIVGMLIWLPVLVEFGYVFLFGPREGLEGRLPLYYFVTTQPQPNASSKAHLPLAQMSPTRGGGVANAGVPYGYRAI
jgi:Na+/melibiose symporter-like transporter